ncbi:MAG TPA: hypothetical protein VFO37_11570, partial [Chitinophagaceae bacterium]|nr:hypothetical protein [Chitinophagaceae bacterium]
MRFGKVFQQTFTRFLDLQKAEAQSREAQIELGLERVRARAMAMQNSDELKELIGTVFTELTKLDLVLTRCLIVIFDPKTNGSTWWMANSETPSDPIGLYIKYHEHPAYLSYVNAWHERDLKWRYILEGKEKKEWDDFLFVETELSQLPDFVIAGMKAPDRVYLNASFNSFGNLTLASLEPLSDEYFDILLRFAKVFDLTYTRFNDLKQAEAQAREAKIEAALERVRSRTMAMHKSDELNETNTVIIQQIRSLEIRLYAFGIHICHADEPISEAWMGDPVGGYMPKVIYDHSQDPLSIRMYAGWKEGKTLAVEKLEGDALKEHFGYMITLVPDRSIFDNLVAPESLVFHFAYFTYGFLVFLTQEPCPEEHSIFKRLANVFEQTYTRFLDLQKAEAQSREAQIELGLERVRARAMAMRNSDELKELIGTVFTELTKLDLVLTRCLIVIFDPKTNGSTWWMANSEAPSDPIGLYIKYHEHPAYLSYVKAWHERDLKWRYILEGKDKKEWDDFLFVETELSQLPDFVIAGMKAPDRVY